LINSNNKALATALGGHGGDSSSSSSLDSDSSDENPAKKP
jgi:hypothetical protein